MLGSSIVGGVQNILMRKGGVERLVDLVEDYEEGMYFSCCITHMSKLTGENF